MKPRDQVAFSIADGEVRHEPVSCSLESAYGSVHSRESEDFDELSRVARDAKAERNLKKIVSGR